MSFLRNNPPKFITTQDQHDYYNEVINLLEENNIAIRDQDVYAIGTLALNLSLLDDCSRSLVEDGMMMEVQGDRNIIVKVNPAVAMQKEAQSALRYYFDRFMMSPNARKSASLSGAGGAQPKSKKDEDSIGSIVVQMKGKN